MNSIFSIGSALLILLLFIHATTTIAQEEEDETKFDYVKNSPRGPSRWGDLDPAWFACKNGTMQSPINLSNQTAQSPLAFEKVKTFYKPSFATLKNRGHDISVQWKGAAGYIQINNINYTLQQAHWHTPTEHTINGARYDLERHMVHFNEVINRFAVIGVLYRIGAADPFLSRLTKKLLVLANTNVNETNAGIIDPTDITTGDKSFYRYNGSLTTPACTENVIWTVQRKIRTVSKYQVNLLKAAIHDNAVGNARPLQAVGTRDVLLYVPRNLVWGDTFSSPAYIETS